MYRSILDFHVLWGSEFTRTGLIVDRAALSGGMGEEGGAEPNVPIGSEF